MEKIDGRPEQVLEIRFKASAAEGDVDDRARDEARLGEKSRVGLVLEGTIAVKLQLGQSVAVGEQRWSCRRRDRSSWGLPLVKIGRALKAAAAANGPAPHRQRGQSAAEGGEWPAVLLCDAKRGGLNLPSCELGRRLAAENSWSSAISAPVCRTGGHLREGP